MNKKRIAYILLIIQTILTAHLIILLNTPGTTTQATATGGEITTLNIQTTPTWGGSYGLLTTGNNTINITAGNIQQNNIEYNDTNNNCTKTELLASKNTITGTITPLDPISADQQLGIDPNKPWSITNTFTEQLTYNIRGNPLTLWSTRTTGSLTQFVQGVANNNGQTIFITETIRNARSYNDEPSNYQLLLTPGNWHITYDETDTCELINEIEQIQPLTLVTLQLGLALPTRICGGTTNTIYGTYHFDRIYCTPEEIGQTTYCQPARNKEVTITLPGETLLEEETDEEGAIYFTPTKLTTYTITITDENTTRSATFKARNCEETSTSTNPDYDRTYTLEQPEITAQEIIFRETPTTEEPTTIEQLARTDLVLITSLAVIIIILTSIGYYEQHKNTNKLLLKTRIWILEKLR